MNVTEDVLLSYAMGHLSPEEEAAVELHLQRHPADAATVAGYLETLTELVFDLPPEPLPEDGEAQLLARVRASAQTYRPPAVIVLPAPPLERTLELSRRGRTAEVLLGVLAAAAVAALFCLTVFKEPVSDAVFAWQLQRYQNQPGAVSYALEAQEAEGQLGTLIRLGSGQVFVVLNAPPESGRVYQAWDIAEAATPLETFGGRTFLSRAAVPQGHTFGVTLEPPGGSPQPTSAPITLAELGG